MLIISNNAIKSRTTNRSLANKPTYSVTQTHTRRLILLEFVLWKMALSLEADLMGGIINKKAVELYLTHTCKHFGNTAAC